MKKLIVCLYAVLFVCAGILATVPAMAGGGTSVKIRLSGPAIKGVVPEGSSEYRVDGTRTSFRVEADRVNMADGTRLTARVNGAAVGYISLLAGTGKLQIESDRGQLVPVIHQGDKITVTTASGVTILSGSF